MLFKRPELCAQGLFAAIQHQVTQSNKGKRRKGSKKGRTGKHLPTKPTTLMETELYYGPVPRSKCLEPTVVIEKIDGGTCREKSRDRFSPNHALHRCPFLPSAPLLSHE